jgi:acyl-CoA hydrolase
VSQQHATTLRFLAEPAHVNFGGKVHGGAVMKWIDQAGYACTAGWSGSYCVTAYVGGIQFMRPMPSTWSRGRLRPPPPPHQQLPLDFCGNSLC